MITKKSGNFPGRKEYLKRFDNSLSNLKTRMTLLMKSVFENVMRHQYSSDVVHGSHLRACQQRSLSAYLMKKFKSNLR